MLEKLSKLLDEQNRGIEDIGIESWISLSDLSESEIQKDIEGWKQLGATHLSVNTMKASMKFPDDHVTAIEKFLQMARS